MNDTNGLLSVCVLCYNHEPYIEECVRSIWDNDYKNVEIVAIDDGSTDDSVAVLKRLKAESPCPFTVIEQENTHNIGLNANRAAKKAQGEFLTFIATDDYYTKDAFSTKLRLMNDDKNIAFVVSEGGYSKLPNGEVVKNEVPNGASLKGLPVERLCEIEYERGTFAIQGMIFRKDVFNAVNGYDEDIRGDDIIIRTKVLQHMTRHPELTCVVLDAPDFYYRRHDNSYSSDQTEMVRILLDAYDRYWPDRPYADYVKESAFKAFKKTPFPDLADICAAHPRMFRFICSNETFLRRFRDSLTKHLRKQNRFAWLVRKDEISDKKTKLVLLNCLKINLKKH